MLVKRCVALSQSRHVKGDLYTYTPEPAGIRGKLHSKNVTQPGVFFSALSLWGFVRSSPEVSSEQ